MVGHHGGADDPLVGERVPDLRGGEVLFILYFYYSVLYSTHTYYIVFYFRYITYVCVYTSSNKQLTTVMSEVLPLHPAAHGGGARGVYIYIYIYVHIHKYVCT